MFPRTIFPGRLFAPTIFPQSQGIVVEFEIHAPRGSVRWVRSRATVEATGTRATVRDLSANPSVRELT